MTSACNVSRTLPSPWGRRRNRARSAAGPGTSAPLPDTKAEMGQVEIGRQPDELSGPNKHPRRWGYVLSGSYLNERSKRTR